MNLSSIACLLTAVSLGTACTTRRALVPVDYTSVTNKVADWQPVKIAKYPPRPTLTRSDGAGAVYRRWFVESGGDSKFGPITFVQVRREDTGTSVELSTTKAVCYGLLGQRHVYFTQRKRWKELRGLLE